MKRFLSFILTIPIFLLAIIVPVNAQGTINREEINISITNDCFQGLADEEQLFFVFLDKQFFGEISLLGTAAREYLNSVEQSLYDNLKEFITDIAHNGGSTETVLRPSDISGLTYTWATGTDVLTEFENQVNIDDVWTALVHDCPYELYWFDKNREGISLGITTVDNGDTISISEFFIFLPVSINWRRFPTYYTTVTSDVGKVKLAVENAVYIADKYDSKDDYTKLTAFKDEICTLVDYNKNITLNGYEVINNSSWQIIDVFYRDKNPDGTYITNKVVSDGYAKAFQYLCDLSEFDYAQCYTTKGIVDGEEYTWNIVTMEDGKTYLVDIASCDTDMPGEFGQYYFAGYDDGGRWSGFVVNDRRYAYHSNNNLFNIELLTLSDKDYLYIPQGTVDYGQCGDNIHWFFNENGTLTIQGWGDMWNGYSTSDNTSNMPPWYIYRKNINNIVIDEGITSIPEYRFYLCQYATTVKIPDTVISIGEMAFYSCMSLEKVDIPDSVKTLGKGCFGNCSSVKSVKLPANITEIPSYFLSCSSITELDIPRSVETIGDHAFYLCGNLEVVNMPLYVKNIGESAFYNYPVGNIKKVYYEGSRADWSNISVSKYNENLTETEIVFAQAAAVIRIEGENRYATAFAIADATKEKLGVDKFSNIIIASGKEFADALAGSYLAKVKQAPILMASGIAKNNNQLKEYIAENLVPGGTVYILGGEAAVPTTLDNALSGFNVKRLSGKSRYRTNIEILKEAGVDDEEILICTGESFADSLAASAVGKPILLVKGSGELLAFQKEYLKELNTDKLYIIGGTSAVGENFETPLKTYGKVERVFGKNRYYTSVEVAKKFFTNPDSAILTYSHKFPDGLAGGPLAMSMDASLILTQTNKQTAAKAYAKSYGITSGAVLGGASLIDDATTMDIFNANSVTVWD